MSAELDRLRQVISAQARVFRRGEVVTETEVAPGVRSVSIEAFPEHDGTRTADVHFLHVGLAEGASKQEFVAALEAARGSVGEFGGSPPDLPSGPSYIEVGGWLGSQQLALEFAGLCELHGVGNVITPSSIGIADPEVADRMAGMGMVFVVVPLPALTPS